MRSRCLCGDRLLCEQCVVICQRFRASLSGAALRAVERHAARSIAEYHRRFPDPRLRPRGRGDGRLQMRTHNGTLLTRLRPPGAG